MLGAVREIPWGDYEEAVPAFVTMLLMPFTYSITNGIGAGFIVYACLKALSGKAREVHPLLWAASAAFIVYFLLPAWTVFSNWLGRAWPNGASFLDLLYSCS